MTAMPRAGQVVSRRAASIDITRADRCFRNEQ
jgi:hypothetical protein